MPLVTLSKLKVLMGEKHFSYNPLKFYTSAAKSNLFPSTKRRGSINFG